MRWVPRSAKRSSQRSSARHEDMVGPVTSRARVRRVAPVELAIAFALVGSLLAVAVPTFVREVHASRLVEPVEGLQRLGAAAVAYGRAHPSERAFPPSSPMTPNAPPRGHCEADPPGMWDLNPTWSALDFRPVPSGMPHCFAFAFDAAPPTTRMTFRAHAHADLDGDGILSTFEVTGHWSDADPRGPVLDPGMFVESELE
jgi:hypothetical protein